MKIIVDLDNPDDVTQALALLTGEQPEYEAAPEPPARAPGRAAPAAGRAAPGKPAAPAPGKPAAGRPAPGRAPNSAPAPSSAPQGGVSKDEFAAAVQAYAKANGPAATKAQFAEYGASIGTNVTMISHVPADDYDNAIQYFPA